MILLHRLYSDTHLFDEVEFIKGINIILGKYSGEQEGREINGDKTNGRSDYHCASIQHSNRRSRSGGHELCGTPV